MQKCDLYDRVSDAEGNAPVGDHAYSQLIGCMVWRVIHGELRCLSAAAEIPDDVVNRLLREVDAVLDTWQRKTEKRERDLRVEIERRRDEMSVLFISALSLEELTRQVSECKAEEQAVA